MAVYTVLTEDELREALAPFEPGRLVAVEPVAAGIENTTYFLTCERGGQSIEYVLTIGESIGASDMAFVAKLTTAFHEDGLPVPAPFSDRDGRYLARVAGKPALLMPKVKGTPPLQPSPAQCHAIGAALGALHRSSSRQTLVHTSHRGLGWVRDTGQLLLPHLPAPSRQLLEAGLTDLEQFVNTYSSLPQPIIHGDLFRDNTLFDGDRLVAIIDFFSAGNGYLLFDLAVVANDWCLGAGRDRSSEPLRALLGGYAASRPPVAMERQSWGGMLAIAALRFCVSRWADRIFPASARPNSPLKDPAPYEKLLREHRERPLFWNVPGPAEP